MRKAVHIYAFASQVILTLVVLGVAGVIIGNRIDPDGHYPALFAGIGLIIGLFLDVIFIIQYMKAEEKNEKRTQD